VGTRQHEPRSDATFTGLQPPEIATLLRFGAVGVVLALAAGGLLIAGTVEPGTLHRLAAARWQAAPIVAGLVVGWWCCHAGRVVVIARALGYPVRFRSALVVSLGTMLGTAATPSAVGAPVLRVTLSRRAGIPVGPAVAMFGLDSALDLAFFALLAPFAALAMWRAPGWRAVLGSLRWPEPGVLVGIGAVVLLGGAAGIWLLRRSRDELSALGRMREVLAVGRRTRAARAALGFLLRHRPGAVALDFLLVTLQWTCRYSTLPVLLWAVGHPLHAVPLILVQALLYAGSAAVVVPGGGGGVEAAAAFVLGQIVPSELVGLVVVAWRLATYHSVLLFGGTVVATALARRGR